MAEKKILVDWVWVEYLAQKLKIKNNCEHAKKIIYLTETQFDIFCFFLIFVTFSR